jgi:hypothetical protein
MEIAQALALLLLFCMGALVFFSRRVSALKDEAAAAERSWFLERVEYDKQIDGNKTTIEALTADLNEARRSPPPRLDTTAQDLMHDLTARGAAVVKITVVDPASILLRSPRE